MADPSGVGGVRSWFSNGGGVVTWRVISTSLAIILLALVKQEATEITARLDKIEARQDAAFALAQTANSRIDVHADRLTTLDNSATNLWTAVHADSQRLDDHEHRLSLLEGARQR